MADDMKLSSLELDALREVGNIGAGHAATALSQMLGTTIRIDVPKVSVIRMEQLPDPLGGPEAVVAATYFRVFGDAPGRMVIFLGRASIGPVLQMLTGAGHGSEAPLDAAEQSAVKELGNILCSAYLNAMAHLMGMQLLPSVPALAFDMVHSVLSTVMAETAERQSQALLIENHFKEASRPVALYLFFIPDSGALSQMLEALAKQTGADPRSKA
jgi:chemotaxis protein CheC